MVVWVFRFAGGRGSRLDYWGAFVSLVHRQIIDRIVVLAKALPRYEFAQNAVYEDPALAIHELGLEQNVGSAIVVEPMTMQHEAMGADIHQNVQDSYLEETDFNFRVIYLAVTSEDRDLLALEFQSSLRSYQHALIRAPRILTTTFGKEGDDPLIYGMSQLVGVKFHTMSGQPDLAL